MENEYEELPYAAESPEPSLPGTVIEGITAETSLAGPISEITLPTSAPEAVTEQQASDNSLKDTSDTTTETTAASGEPSDVTADTGVSIPVTIVLCLTAAFLTAVVIQLIRQFRNKRKHTASGIAGISVGKLHEQGARQEQQDSFGVSDEALTQTHGFLAVVADGMGGLQNGGMVSSAAVESVLDQFMRCPNTDDPRALLLSLAQAAAKKVNALLGPSNYRKSGSTLVMGYVRDDKFTFLSIGDSRVSLYRGGVLMQLNRDHIYEGELFMRAVNGEISVDSALTDAQGSGLISFLGMGQLHAVDLPSAPLQLLPGDRILLMSDGVYNALTDSELSAMLEGATPEEAALRIGASIREKNYSNQDNYTAVVIGCDGQ